MIARILFLLLLPWVAFGAVPSYEKFKGAGTVTITTNPPNGDVTITGSGATLTQVTNAASVTVTNLTPSIVAAAAASNALYEPRFINIDGDSISTTNYVGPGKGWVDMLRTNSPWSSYSFTNTATDFRTMSNVSLNFPGRGGGISVVSNTVPQWMTHMSPAGLNDLVNNHGTNAIFRDESNTWRQARAMGYQVVAFTIMRSSYDYYASNTPIPAFTTNRWAVNNFIRGYAKANRLYDILVDVDTRLTNAAECEWDADLEENACGTLLFLDTLDGVHLSTTGNLKYAHCVLTSMVRHAVQPIGVLGGTMWGDFRVFRNVQFDDRFQLSQNGGTTSVLGGTNADGSGRWKTASAVAPLSLHTTPSTIVLSNDMMHLNDGTLELGDSVTINGVTFLSVNGSVAFTSAGLSPLTGASALSIGYQAAPWSNLWANSIHDLSAINWLVETRLIPTNNAASNIVVNMTLTNTVEMWLTNNATFTNWAVNAAGSANKLLLIRPQLIPRGVNWGNLGLANPGYGVAIGTNANNPLWTTLTNGKTYALSITAVRTNLFPAISLWE